MDQEAVEVQVLQGEDPEVAFQGLEAGRVAQEEREEPVGRRTLPEAVVLVGACWVLWPRIEQHKSTDNKVMNDIIRMLVPPIVTRGRHSMHEHDFCHYPHERIHKTESMTALW